MRRTLTARDYAPREQLWVRDSGSAGATGEPAGEAGRRWRRFAFTLWATAGNWSLPPPTCSYLLSSARPSPDGRVCASAAVVRRPRCGPVLGVCRGEHLVLLGGGRIPEVGGVASRCHPGRVAELVEAVVATSVHDLGVAAALPGDDALLERARRRGRLCRCVLDGHHSRWR